MFVEGKGPDEAWAPMAADYQQHLPPYRDAGYGAATYWLTIPDILRGLHKAVAFGLLHLSTFDREEYEFFERVENGDFNWICDKFIAIASPHDERTSAHNGHIRLQRTPQSSIMDLFAARDATMTASLDTLVGRNAGSHASLSKGVYGQGRRRRDGRPLYSCYRVEDLVAYFKEYGVAAMVRLNNRLYDRNRFIENGIAHHELYFPDGTTPPENILRRFLEICESTPGPVAVHCKAGLGRTGSLIACYLMKHYLFTAAEVIGFLRVLRPGSIVGPQQNWLASMQHRMWKLHPTQALPGHISMLREPSFIGVTAKASETVRQMERMASELEALADGMDLDPQAADVSKMAVPKQPRKPAVATPVNKGPIRRSKSQQMHDSALHSLETLQLTSIPYKVVKPGKVRPAPKIDTASKPSKERDTPTSASSSGTMVATPSSATSKVYSLRNYISGALGFGTPESK